jgi:hypothetical protein
VARGIALQLQAPFRKHEASGSSTTYLSHVLIVPMRSQACKRDRLWTRTEGLCLFVAMVWSKGRIRPADGRLVETAARYKG